MKQSRFALSDAAGRFETPIEEVVSKLQSQSQGKGLIDPAVAASAISMESMSATDQSVLQTSVQNLSSAIKAATSGVKDFAKLTVAQEDAAYSSGIAAHAPKQFLAQAIRTAGTLKAAYGDANTVVIGNEGGTSDDSKRMFGLESYDEKENKNAMVYSVAYNMQASRQNDFGEAFFPTVVVTPDQVGFSVSIRLMYVYDEIAHQLNGALSDFKRKNVIKAMIDSTILRNDQTKIVPVYRKTNPVAPTDSDANFVTGVAPSNVLIEGTPVSTAPLKVGRKLNLIGVSTTAALLATGVQDQTDSIDSSVRLDNVYLSTAGGDIIKFPVSRIAGSDFNAAVQGNSRNLNLSFSTPSLLVNAATLTVDGSTPSFTAALGVNSVRLAIDMFGLINQQTGDTTVNAGAVTITKVMDDSGNTLALTSGVGATMATDFAGATIVGYDLIAYRTNSNRRMRGQLVDTQYVNYLYTVPLLPPVTAIRPVSATEANDSALLSTLIMTTHVRTSNSAVTTLLDAQQFLKSYVNAADPLADAPEILGVARYLVTPAYAEATLDSLATINSLTSADRTNDLVSLIINKVRDMSYRLYSDSGYKAAADSLYDGAAPKPTVIIGCDQVLGRYLTLNGEMRLMGDQFDFKLVTSLDKRMQNKIIFSFGMESSFNSGVPNPMHFGNMAWKPELTLMMPATRNGTNSMELTVQPSYRHVVNLPILGVLTVTNIQAVIAGNVAINSHPV
jgi:hypothetical protein